MLELVGKKIGMSHLFKDNGVAVPLTMVQIYDNCVLDLVVNENKMIRNRAESLAYSNADYQRSVRQRLNFQIKNVKQQL